MERNTEQAGIGTQARDASVDCAKVAHRDKTWSECGIEEKVDRLRVVLRVANERSLQAQRTAVAGVEVAKRHEHGGSGRVVMPVETGMNSPLMIAKGEGESDYFANLLA